jgi:predicted nucleic acid-binding protein
MTLLLDSGVWLAARDAEDAHHPYAVELLAGARPIAALDLTLHEVANVGVRSWDSAERARLVAQLDRAACSDTIVQADDAQIEQAIEIAAEHGISVYDASYVAAARRNNWTLVSTDHRDLVGRGLALAPKDAVATG